MINLPHKLNKHRLLRKSIALINKIPRTFKRRSVSANDYYRTPPVIGNSIPKSGTHLLLQVIDAIPNLTNYGTFIASKPAITFRERSKKSHLQMLRCIVPAEAIPAHIYYDTSYHEELIKKNSVVYFIYRDPRDVAISEAYYLTYSYRIHRLHRYYVKNLANMSERILAEILGITDPEFPCDFPNIADRFARYRGWLYSPDVFSVRFEDLVSRNRIETLQNMASFYDE